MSAYEIGYRAGYALGKFTARLVKEAAWYGAREGTKFIGRKVTELVVKDDEKAERCKDFINTGIDITASAARRVGSLAPSSDGISVQPAKNYATAPELIEPYKPMVDAIKSQMEEKLRRT